MAMTAEAFNKMMGVITKDKLFLNGNGKPVLDLYLNSFGSVNEYDKKLCFDCDSNIEESITDFLDASGFSSDDNGYKYLRYILFSCVKRLNIPLRIGALYIECGKTFGVSESCVDMSIIKAIITAFETEGLMKINDIFNIELFKDCEKPTNSDFITSIGNRFIFCKKYGIQLPYRA